MKRALIVSTITLVIFLLSGCSETITVIEPESRGLTSVKFIHSAPSISLLDWTYYNSSNYSVYDIVLGAAYGTDYGYYQVEAGRYEFRLYEPDSVFALAIVTYNFDPDKYYSIVAYDYGRALNSQILVLRDTSAALQDGQSLVRFLNLSANIQSIRITSNQGGEVVSLPEMYRPSHYLLFNEGEYLFNFSETESDSPVLISDSLHLNSGDIYTVILSGSTGGYTPVELNVRKYKETKL